jgi:hypothetical protein
VSVLCHLDFSQDEIANHDASGANVSRVITSHHLLVLCQLDDCDLT